MKLPLHKLIIALLVVNFAGTEVLARPSWTSTPPQEDQSFKYYVGRSEPADTEAEAFRMAVRSAYEEALRENYGVALEVSTTTFESESSLEIVRHQNESSQKVIIENFKQIDSHKETLEGGQVVVWVLYKYPQAAIARERQRLSAGEQDAFQYSVVGSDDLGNSTDVLITSRPSGAEVFIDEIRWGRTPVRLKGAVAPGLHDLHLSHPQYDELKQRIMVPAQNILRVEKNLLPAKGKLSITTIPASARITIDGVYVGESPISEYRVAAGKPMLILATHPDAEEIRQRIVVEKDSLRELELHLPLKPSFLKITNLCAGCTVKVDQVLLTSSQLRAKLSLNPGSHLIIIEKSGCDPESEEVLTKAAETLVYAAPVPSPTQPKVIEPSPVYSYQEAPTHKFNMVDSRAAWRSLPAALPATSTGQPFQSATIVSFGFSFNTQATDSKGDAGTIGFSFGLEKRFLRYFGVRGSVSCNPGTMSVENPEPSYASPTHDYIDISRQAGGVLYFGDSPTVPFVAYEVGSLERTLGDKSPIPSFSMDRSIITFGISDFKSNFTTSISFYSNALPKRGRHDSIGLNMVFFAF